MQPRPTPYDLVFADTAADRFTGIRNALTAAGQDGTDRDGFLMVREVVELIRDLRPDDGMGEGIEQLAALGGGEALPLHQQGDDDDLGLVVELAAAADALNQLAATALLGPDGQSLGRGEFAFFPLLKVAERPFHESVHGLAPIGQRVFGCGVGL